MAGLSLVGAGAATVRSPAAPPARGAKAPAARGSKPAAASAEVSSGPVPKKMQRAKVWSFEVENTFRLQEAGYRDVFELLALGQPEPEVWPTSQLIKKLRTKTSLGGGMSLLYFRERPECGPKDLNKVKLYSY